MGGLKIEAPLYIYVSKNFLPCSRFKMGYSFSLCQPDGVLQHCVLVRKFGAFIIGEL